MTASAEAIQPPLQSSSHATKIRLDLATCSEKTLVESAQRGEIGAFELLIKRHYRFSMNKAYSILRNHDDAEDEVQNACMEAWKHLSRYQGQGTFGAWFSRIVSNQCLMRLRSRKPMISVDDVLDSEDAFRLEVIDQRPHAEEHIGDREVMRVLIHEIHGVPRLLREVLVMRDLREVPMPQVAARLRITIPAAKSRLMRARQELKLRLMKHLGEKGIGTLILHAGRSRAAYVRAC